MCLFQDDLPHLWELGVHGDGVEWADTRFGLSLVSCRLEHQELLSSVGSECWRIMALSKTR